jgi:alpha-ketoglutaric semialdehyde dehydrogenase
LPEILNAKGSTLAAAIAQSVTLGNGQFCTNPGVIALPKEEGKPFIKALKNALETGSKGVMVHPNIQESYDRQLEALKKTQPEVEVFQSQEGGPALGVVAAQTVWEKPEVLEEVFGPFTLIVVHGTASEMATTASAMEGQLTATLQGTPEELKKYSRLQGILQQKVGRLLFEGVPTGVSVCQTMMHGGPFPASTDSRYTAVGSDAIYRWLRPLAFQDAPQHALPLALQDQNPLGIERKIDNQWTNAPI